MAMQVIMGLSGETLVLGMWVEEEEVDTSGGSPSSDGESSD